MASIHETHSGVAGVTPQGQPRTLHGTADDVSRETTAVPPGPGPVRSITRGEAESSHKRTDSKESRARKRQPNHQEARPRANRVLVLDAHGKPLMPCSPRRARQLIDAKRVAKRFYRPFTIQLKDRSVDDGTTATQPVEVRTTPGVRRTGIALVALLENEERTLYEEEIQHRSDISTRLQERKSHRGRRRGERWYRAPRFNNRRRAADRLPPSLKSVVSNQEHRIGRLSARSGAATVVLQDSKFDTQKVLNPGIHGKEYQQGPLYKSHLREYVAEQWKHQCAYCGKEDWKDHTRFELDHIVPRSRNGPTNIGNIVWACHPCNHAKSDSDLETFLEKNPDRSTACTDQRRPAAAARGRWEYGMDLPDAPQAAQHPGTKDQEDDRGGQRAPSERTRDHEEPRQRRGLLRKQPRGHRAATACSPQSCRTRAPQADQEPAREQVPDVETPATGRTAEDPVSRTRAAPKRRVRRGDRRPGAHTQRQEMGERQSASHSRGETRCHQRQAAVRQHEPKAPRATNCTPKRIPRIKLRHYPTPRRTPAVKIEEFRVPAQRYAYELEQGEPEAVDLCKLPASWAEALTAGTAEAIDSTTPWSRTSLRSLMRRKAEEGYAFDRTLARRQRTGRSRETTEDQESVTRWIHTATAEALRKRNLYGVGTLDESGTSYRLRRGVDGVLRIPLNYCQTLDARIFHPPVPAKYAPQSPLAGEDTDAGQAFGDGNITREEVLDVSSWNEGGFAALREVLEAYGWRLDLSLPNTERDGWNAGRWGLTRLAVVTRADDLAASAAAKRAAREVHFHIWCPGDKTGIAIPPREEYARQLPSLEAVREDAWGRLGGRLTSEELHFRCWNRYDDDGSFGFGEREVASHGAVEVMTAAVSDLDHFCVYVNGYYAYQLCGGPSRQRQQHVWSHFWELDLPPRRQAFAREDLRRLMVCQCYQPNG